MCAPGCAVRLLARQQADGVLGAKTNKLIRRPLGKVHYEFIQMCVAAAGNDEGGVFILSIPISIYSFTSTALWRF